MPKIIQFLHPGLEATPLHENDNFIPWNNHEKHRRKFLISPGVCLTKEDHKVQSSLTFWGEWEPQSEIIKIRNRNGIPPTYFNIPYIDASVSKRRHTTDPYVFGKRFKYFICRQRACHNILKHLEPNSIILFGSSINEKFCLDTLFVTSAIKCAYTRNTLAECFPVVARGQFYLVAIDPIYANTNQIDEEDYCSPNENESLVYYESVDFDDRLNYRGMYSFVPCRIYDKANSHRSVFGQPELDLDFINGAQTQGINSIECSVEEIKSYWKEIIKQVEKKDLLRAISLKTPDFR